MMTVPPRLPQTLPIDAVIGDILTACKNHNRVLVEAPPGAGKTTRVPVELLRSHEADAEIWIAEPRRLAAKLAAHRVAHELQSELGNLVGYTVRFEDCSSKKTRIRFVTSGILLRKLLSDPDLRGLDCVILDEFHERHVDTDLCLALSCEAQNRRPALRLLVMSATLDGARLSQLLGDCPRITSEGRLYPLEIQYEAQADDRPLEKKIASSLRQQLHIDPNGSVLIFLPGAAEIRRAQLIVAPMCEQASVDLRVLHGDMPLDAQAAAVTPGARPRIVLTTNVAESSVTVDGITAVIDSGLCRKHDSSTYTGVSRLSLQKISRASATQRAGRAARVAPGRVHRLYTKGDYQTRREFDIPEILCTDFSESLLLLSSAAWNRRDVDATHPPPVTRDADAVRSGSFEHLDRLLLLDQPGRAATELAYGLLRQLNAVDADCRVTQVGRRLVAMPVHPRLARLVVECDQRGIGSLGALVAALLAERDLRLTSRASLGSGTGFTSSVFSGNSDVLELVEAYLQCEREHPSRSPRDQGVDPNAFRSVRQLYRQLLDHTSRASTRIELDTESETLLAQALLVAFPDRIAKRRSPGSPELVLCSGAIARLDDASVVRSSEWLLAIDAEERQSGRHCGVLVRIASAISTDWLLDSVSEMLVSEEELCWVDPPGRVETRSRLRLGSLVVEESRRPARPGAKVTALLRSVIEQSGLLRSNELLQLTTRLELLEPELLARGLAPDHARVLDAVIEDCLSSRVDLAGLDGASLASSLLAYFPSEILDLLRSMTPEHIVLSHGRRCQIHYESGRPPWIASRLQDFFGQITTPTILSGRKKLVVHLLAPNQRAVQITEDLEGFWRNHYPEIRRQLARRYPKHAWPEDGLTARPPDPKPPRHGQ